jgi:hypothetical protein
MPPIGPVKIQPVDYDIGKVERTEPPRRRRTGDSFQRGNGGGNRQDPLEIDSFEPSQADGLREDLDES